LSLGVARITFSLVGTIGALFTSIRCCTLAELTRMLHLPGLAQEGLCRLIQEEGEGEEGEEGEEGFGQPSP